MKTAGFLTALACTGLFVAGCGDGGGSLGPPPTPGRISGRVSEAASGAALPGTTVTTQPGSSTVQSDAQGNYLLENVAPGSYALTAAKSGYSNGSANATVTGGQTTTANFALTTLPTTGTISGQVTDAASGAALLGATVTTQPVISTVQTDAEGNYTIPNVAPGSYIVTAATTGYNNGSADATVTAGQTSTANIALSPGGPANFDGTWSGTTSQGQPISFTVQNNALMLWSMGLVFNCATATATFQFLSPLPITANTFTFGGRIDDPNLTTLWSVSGTFDTPTSASGYALVIPTAPPGCVAVRPTWTATKG